MDSNTPEFVVQGPPTTAASGVVLRVPLFETLTVVEFGFFVSAGADLAAGVLKLQVLDSTTPAGNPQDLCVLTSTASMVQSTIGARRCDVLIDKLLNVAVGPGGSGNTNGTISPAAGKQFVAIQLNASTAFTASSVITPYVKLRKQGSGGTAVAGEFLVTT